MLIVVQGDIGPFNQPGIVARLTTGEGSLIQADNFIAKLLQAFSSPTHSRFIHYKTRIIETGIAALRIDISAIRTQQQTRFAHLNVAIQLGLPAHLVKGKCICIKRATPLSQANIVAHDKFGLLFGFRIICRTKNTGLLRIKL